MAFTAQSTMVGSQIRVTWKLAMRLVGQETEDIPGFEQNADNAWVRVEGERRYSQYSVVKDPHAQEGDLGINLNDFV
jgi:hypothetical protein